MKSVSVQWYEIPVREMDRAINFYQKVFDCELSRQVLDDFQMLWFPFHPEQGGASGSLVYHEEFYEISPKAGVLVYFGVDDCEVELSRVEAAGGKVEIPKRMIAPDIGFMGVIIDAEGNRLAFHSNR